MSLARWWRDRGHDTNDVWCIYWVNHCRGPVARCPACSLTGGYAAIRRAQAAPLLAALDTILDRADLSEDRAVTETHGEYAKRMLDAVTTLDWSEVPSDVWAKFLVAGDAYANFLSGGASEQANPSTAEAYAEFLSDE